jgi:23S rRNA pseudouridine1911/1915/1917 synthase
MSEPLVITVIVPETCTVDRLDRWLAGYLASVEDDEGMDNIPPLSRSRLKALILDGNIGLNNHPAVDPSQKVCPGDEINLTIPPPQAAAPKGEDIPLDVLYEDNDIIVMDKPAGLVTHPAPGAPDGTLVNALINHCGDSLTGIGGERRPGIVHRLDKDTSGVMMAAKTAQAHANLTDMFAAHDLDRVYTALVWGIPTQRQQTIDASIGRSSRDRKKMMVTEKGRHATTYVDFTRALPPLASVGECRLKTGRTHQIRVHMAHIGHGIIGDPHYGRPMRAGQMPDNALREALADLRAFKRQALHASYLGFRHPITDEPLSFSTPIPKDMHDLIANLEIAIKKRGHL